METNIQKEQSSPFALTHQIEEFRFNLSPDQITHLSNLSGIEESLLESKLLMLLESLFYKLLLLTTDLKKDLESIIKVRSQGNFSNKKLSLSRGKVALSGHYLKQPFYALAALLRVSPEKLMTELSESLSFKQEEVKKLLGFLSPYFLNQLALFLETSEHNFFTLETHSNSEKKEGLLSHNTKLPLKGTRRNTILAFLLSIAALYTLFFLVQLLFNDLFSEEETSNNASITAPLLSPEYSKDSTSFQLLSHLQNNPKDSLSQTFLIQGFNLSGKEASISDRCIEDIFNITRILEVYPNYQIIINRADNNHILAYQKTQNKFIELLVYQLMEFGISEDRISYEQFEAPWQIETPDLYGEFTDVSVAFRIEEINRTEDQALAIDE